MSDVKRWGPDDGGMVLWCDRSISPEYDYTGGTYVHSTDYDALRSQLDEAKKAYENACAQRAAMSAQLVEARAERNKYDGAHKREARNVLRLTAEREACAKVCDELKAHEHTGDGDRYWWAAFDCAAAIRARASDLKENTLNQKDTNHE